MSKSEDIFTNDEDGFNPFVYDDKYHFVLVKKTIWRADKQYMIDYANKLTLYNFRHRKNTIDNMSPNACKMFLKILTLVQDRRDVIYINKEDYIKDTNCSARTFERALFELIEKNIIKYYRGRKHRFWINPAFFFAGNRLNKYPDNITKI
jgi:hypothetical protein